MSTLRPIDAPVVANGDLDRLRGPAATPEQERARLRKAAQEFEALFMYQMLKAMRQTVGESSLAKNLPLGGSLGKDTYTDLFDLELARGMATGGHGSISDILCRALEKTVTADSGQTPVPTAIRPLESGDRERKAIAIQGPRLPLDRGEPHPAPLAPKRPPPLPPRPNHAAPPAAPPPPRAPVQAPPAEPMPESAPADAADPIQARFGRWIDEAAEANRLDSALIRAVIAAESGGNPRAVSPAGAKGLMQLMDTTAADMGVKEPFDARENIMSGTKYLRRLIDRFGDLKLALAAYNAGPGTVERHGGVPPYAETRAYVEKVLDSARALAADGGAPDGESKAPGGARR